jgi:hypothetical protein
MIINNKQIGIMGKCKTFNIETLLGVSKKRVQNIIKEQYDYSDDGRFDGVWAIISRKGNEYTAEEAKEIVISYITSHDDCVMDNSDDFHRLVVHQTELKVGRSERAIEILNTNNS